MQLKNSLLLLTALTAGSAVAHPHGHEHRHAHAEEKRAVGDIVTVTMFGKVVTWENTYAGPGGATATVDDSPAAATAAVAEPDNSNPDVVAAAAVPTSEPTSEPVTSAPGSCANWDDTLENGDYTLEGFGPSTQNNGKEYIDYMGNVGIPWGSNIIEVSEDTACKYKHVVKIDAGKSDDWTVVFWNKMGPDGKLTGWYGFSALTIKIEAGKSKYVAFDDDTQGAWGAAKGDSLPKDIYGGYSCTWGEFDFSNKNNDLYSGWDVSAIQAQFANQEVQGMKICDNGGGRCSHITNFATDVFEAYTTAEEGVDGIGGAIGPGPVRLVTILDYTL